MSLLCSTVTPTLLAVEACLCLVVHADVSAILYKAVSGFWGIADVSHGGAGQVVDVEEGAVEALRTGLQCSHLAADTVFSQVKALTGGPLLPVTHAGVGGGGGAGQRRCVCVCVWGGVWGVSVCVCAHACVHARQLQRLKSMYRPAA